MLKRLKHNTAIMKQSMKSNKGPQFLDEHFEEAVAHYKELNQKVKSFLDDAQAVINCIPRIFRSNADLVQLTEKSYSSFPEEERTLAAQLSELAAAIQQYVNEDMKMKCDEEVIKPLKEFLGQLGQLKVTKKEQHDNFMLLEANKGKLEDLRKDYEKKANDKKAAKVSQYEEKVKTRTEAVEKLEAEFIERVRDLWSERYSLVGKPLQTLMVIVCDVGKTLVEKAGPVMATLGPDYMARDYPADEPQEKKKKK